MTTSVYIYELNIGLAVDKIPAITMPMQLDRTIAALATAFPEEQHSITMQLGHSSTEPTLLCRCEFDKPLDGDIVARLANELQQDAIAVLCIGNGGEGKPVELIGYLAGARAYLWGEFNLAHFLRFSSVKKAITI